MKEDFWGMLGFYLLFIIFAAGMTYWGGYVTFALVVVVSGIVGSLAIAYFFRPDSRSRG